MSERCYYKVEDTNSELFKNASDFLNMEQELRENKKKAAQDKVFSWYGLQCTQDEADAICIGKYFVLEKGKKKTTWGEEI